MSYILVAPGSGGGGGGGTVTQINTQDSIDGGPITGSGTITLVNDNAAPGNNYYYGTDGSGTKGFFTLPAAGVTSVSDDGGGVVTVDNSNPATPVVGFGGVNVRVPSLLYGDGKSGTPLSTYISKDTFNDNYFTGLTGPTAPGAYNMLFDAYTTTVWNATTGSKNVMLGYNIPPSATGDSNIVIGDTANSGLSSEQYTIAIGKSTTALNSGSIALGRNAATTTTQQFVVGGNTGSGAEIPNWKINGVEYVMPSAAAAGTYYALVDALGNGTLSWQPVAAGVSGGNFLIGQTSGIISNPTATTFNEETWLGELAGNGISASDAVGSTILGKGAGSRNGGTHNLDKAVIIGNQAGADPFSTDIDAENSIFIGTQAGFTTSQILNAKNSIFIGWESGKGDTVNNTVSGTSILIGNKTNTGGFSDSIAIGHGANNTAANQFLVSAPLAHFTNIHLEGTNTTFFDIDASNGLFKMSANGTDVFSFDYGNQLYQMGDVSVSANGTTLVLDDINNQAYITGNYVFPNTPLFLINSTSGTVSFGDVNGVGNGVYFGAQNISQSATIGGNYGIGLSSFAIFDFANGTSKLGDTNTAVNGTIFTVDDANENMVAILDNIFKVQNHFGSKFLNLDQGTRQYGIGDLDNNNGDPFINIDGVLGSVTVSTPDLFKIISHTTGSSFIQLSTIAGSEYITIGSGIDSNRTFIDITDSTQKVIVKGKYGSGDSEFVSVDFANGTTAIGDNSAADNGTILKVDDVTGDINLYHGNVLALQSDTNSNIRAFNLHNNATAQGDSSNQDIRSGTYTPTASNQSNITSLTVSKAQWMRVGNVVTVSGTFEAQATTGGNTGTAFSLSLPVASSLVNLEDCAGTATASNPVTFNSGGQILADTANDEASFNWGANTTVSSTWSYIYTYEVK